ncbi:unnamed protein product [Paramecium pentaurelia]|uniref:Protein kinase domain-containing protein n=1 Tax=Paramecium pentaurelia TaxID=43138 RepID=A0A8S1S3Y1_9CILI|nr:unnamed protein product [Paramecium pentaurelia]
MNKKQEIINYPPDKRISSYIFSLKAIIGKGSYGIVYLGKHETTQKLVAIKVIDRRSVDFDIQSQEIAIMKQLNHPNIVQLIDFVISVNNLYIITEYCNGTDLKTYLQENSPLSEESALKIIKSIIRGLKCIIQNNFIHRDIKPANILFDNDQLKIADFGFSRRINNTMTSIVGTPIYMAPQILFKQEYTSKCDIWSLGVVFFELLFGKLPWMASDIIDLLDKIQNQSLIIPKQPKISFKSTKFLQGCLEKQEKNRLNWSDIFNYFATKENLKIQINSFYENNQSFDNKTQRIYYFNKTFRERTNSSKFHYAKSNDSIENQTISQTKRKDSSKTILKNQNLQNIRRTQSKFENVKQNQNSTLIIKKNNVSFAQIITKVYLNTIQDCLKPQINKSTSKRKTQNLFHIIEYINTLSNEASKKGYHNLFTILLNQKSKLLLNQVNLEKEINYIKDWMKLSDDSSLKKKIELYLKWLKLQALSKENQNNKLGNFHSS